jgi:hypothetical protein
MGGCEVVRRGGGGGHTWGWMFTVSGALPVKPMAVGARGRAKWTKCSCSTAMLGVLLLKY